MTKNLVSNELQIGNGENLRALEVRAFKMRNCSTGPTTLQNWRLELSQGTNMHAVVIWSMSTHRGQRHLSLESEPPKSF